MLGAMVVVRRDWAEFVDVWRWCRSDMVEFGVEVWPLAIACQRQPRKNGAVVVRRTRPSSGGSGLWGWMSRMLGRCVWALWSAGSVLAVVRGDRR